MKVVKRISIPMIVMFSIILFVPSLTFVLLYQPSYASGILISSSLIILLSIFYQLKTNVSTLKNVLKKILVVGLLLLIHSVFVLSLLEKIDFFRFLSSIFILLIVFFGAFAFVAFLNKINDTVFKASLMQILAMLLIVSFSGGILHYSPFSQYSMLNKPIFPYMEASHFSLIIAPFFIWFSLTRKKISSIILVMIYGIALLFFMNNLTFAIVLLLSAVLAVRFKNLTLFIPLLVLLIIASNYNLNYYIIRMDLQNENLSTLVWLQGWEEAYLNFIATYGLGVGFQQFGMTDPKGDAANTILMLTSTYMNRYDGSTFSSKLIGEFGILGFLIIGLFTWMVFKSYLFLKYLNGEESNKLIFFHSCIVYFFIELYIRSMSYIAPGFFIFIVGCLGVYLNSLEKKIQKNDFNGF